MAKRTPKATTAIEPDDRTIPGAWISASLVPGESATSRNNQNTGRDYELVTRGITGTAYRAATINATVLAGQTLRLFRAASSGMSKAGRKVADRRTLKHATNRGATKSLIGKAASYASRAGDEVEEVLEHPVLDLLHNPDPIYTGPMWLHQIFWFKETAGRAYLYVGERGAGNMPVSAYILPSQFAWPMLSDTGFIEGYYYGRNRSAPMRIPSSDVVYLRQHGSPVHPAGGMSWLFSVMAETDMEAAALQAEANRWLNGGNPGMVFKAAPTTTDAQMKQIHSHINQMTRGVGKAGSVLLLRDTELQQYGAKPHEMQYVEGLTTTEKRIYDAAGIPEPIYRLNSANLASATVANAQYMRYTIAPRLAVLASELTELLLPHFGVEPGEMWFCFDDPTQEDQLQLAAELRAAEAQGIITPNEYRKVLDLEALPEEQNMLRYRQTDAPAPAGLGIFGGGSLPAPSKAEEMPSEDVGTMDVEATTEVTPEDSSIDEDELETKAKACTCGACKPAVKMCDNKPCDVRPRLKVPKRCKAATQWDDETGTPVASVSAYRAFERDMLAWYRMAVPSMVNDAGLAVFPSDEAMADLAKIAEKFIQTAILTGGMEGMSKIGVSPDAFNVANESAMSYVRNRGLFLATTVPDTLKPMVQAAIERELAKGTSIGDLRNAIKEEAPDLAEWQAVRIARTETANAYCEGNRLAWEQEGVQTKQWIVAGGPCPICDAIAETYPGEIPIGEAFSAGGWSGQAPTAHPNCVLPDTRVDLPSFNAAMRSHYTGDVVEIKTSGGRVLTVTANHPLLTMGGWCRACDIKQGNDLVCAGWSESAFINPNKNHVVPTAEQVFKTAEMSGRMSAKAVESTAHHLHGDGVSVDGKIDVVLSDRGLMFDCVSTLSKHGGKTAFVLADSLAKRLNGQCSLDERLLTLAAAANGCVSLCELGQNLVLGKGGSESSIGLTDAQLAETKTLEGVRYGLSTASELLGKSCDALASSGVQVEQVASVVIRQYSGHVYNFSTLGNVYVSNGIIAHNCRCDLLPGVEYIDE